MTQVAPGVVRPSRCDALAMTSMQLLERGRRYAYARHTHIHLQLCKHVLLCAAAEIGADDMLWLEDLAIYYEHPSRVSSQKSEEGRQYLHSGLPGPQTGSIQSYHLHAELNGLVILYTTSTSHDATSSSSVFFLEKVSMVRLCHHGPASFYNYSISCMFLHK